MLDARIEQKNSVTLQLIQKRLTEVAN